ncbi:universal stress protein [Ideonella sp. BN130291]|uniref:universal stress protein n=1 Tax=Ideonella sp. BN130291 TaxID=3112940 RepID=UPI002E254C72|nr:universal stress protein [Ideonella sp. BN130291]
MKILLPVDGSDYTKRMLDYVVAHDDLLGDRHEYIAFTAVAPIPAHATRFLDRATLDGYYLEQAQQALLPASAFSDRRGWRVRTAHTVGHAAEAITAFAEAEKCALIVMGTHGHSALRSVVLGSVSRGVLARCATPVLLIR